MAPRPDRDRILTAKLIGAAARLADDPDDEATIATLRAMLAGRPSVLAAAAAEHWAIRGAEGNTDPVRAATAARRLSAISRHGSGIRADPSRRA